MLVRLRDGGVKFVVIGGVAGTIHGSPYLTSDLDICVAVDKKNLERLAVTLSELDAKEWDPRKDAEREVEWSVDTLRVDKTWLLVTPMGPLDILFEPAGTEGYQDLSKMAVEYEIAGGPIAVAHIEDLIRMKEVAGRQRDRAHLPTLRKLAERRLSSESDL
jgi:predicted nucleotidyltransferase